MCIFMWQASLGVTSSLLRIHPFAKCLLPIDLRFQADLRQKMFVSYVCIHNGLVDTTACKKINTFSKAFQFSLKYISANRIRTLLKQYPLSFACYETQNVFALATHQTSIMTLHILPL